MVYPIQTQTWLKIIFLSLPMFSNFNSIEQFSWLFGNNWYYNALSLSFCFSFEMESRSVSQAGVRWPDLGSLQLCPLDLSYFSALASWVAETTGTCHHIQLIFVFLVETGFQHIGQAGGLKLLTSWSASLSLQSARILGMSHHAWPKVGMSFNIVYIKVPSLMSGM